MLIWAGLTTVCLRLSFVLKRTVAAGLRTLGLGHSPCLIAGREEQARHFAEALNDQAAEGLHIAGFVDLDRIHNATSSVGPVLGSWSAIVGIAERLRVHQLLICCPPEDLAEIAPQLPALRAAGIDVAYVMLGPSELLRHDEPTELAGYPLLPLGSSLGGPHIESFWSLIEQLAAAMGILLLAPLAPLIGVLSFLAGRSWPLERTSRVGRGGRSFAMFRFRTFSPDEPETGGGMLGRFLRWTHLDELPQLINVLRREMSFVGPRPIRPEIARKLSAEQRARFTVRPGITGIWQLDRMRRWRLEQMLTSDLLYVLRRSPALDLKILAQTLLGRRNP